MTLLYLAIAYLLGIFLGCFLWAVNGGGCHFPNWLWWLPFSLLPVTPLLSRFPVFQRTVTTPLRWPVSAGFEAPTVGPSPVLLIALGLSLVTGVLRYASHPLMPCWQPTDLAYYNLPADHAFDRSAPEVMITGYISSYPLLADTKQRMQVVATTINVDGVEHAVNGELRLSTGIRQRHDYGQPVRVQGRLVTPPEFTDFSYRDYLARKGIYSLLYGAHIETLAAPLVGNPLLRMLYAFRSRGEVVLNRLLPEPYAALGNGMLLGIEAGIPDELYEQFNITAVSHILVISGSNISLLSAILLAVGQKVFGQRRALWPMLISIGCYALLVGGDAAVLRAALMGGLFVIATTIGRRSTAIVSLAAACWAMTMVNPLTLWDVGFQLSSAATAGLILFSSRITSWVGSLWSHFTGNGPSSSTLTTATFGVLQSLVQDGLLVTIAANVTTLPLVLYYFGRLSLISLLTNVLIAPVQGFIMVWGSAGVVIGVAGLESLAQVVLWVPWLCLVWTVAIVQWTAAIPGASLEITGYHLGHLLLTYLLIALHSWRSQLHTGVQRVFDRLRISALSRLMSWSAAGVLAIGAILIWVMLLTQPDGRLHVYFLDIGQGDGILIQTPSGRQLLLDGGSSPQRLFSQLGAVMPFWDRSLDMVVLTNPDKDHMDAQAQASTRLQITTALETKASQANPDADPWRANLANDGATIQLQHQDGWIDLGDGVALWVLWPPSEPFLTAKVNNEQLVDNENSLIMKLVYGDFSVLLTGDAGLPAETELLAANASVSATVLKVGHHGSKGSTSAPFVQGVNPLVAVIQVGTDNSYGHPHPETLERLSGRHVLRNDLHGRIHIYSDGHHMWVEPEALVEIP